MDSGRIKILIVTVALVLFLHISVGVEKQTARNLSGRIAQNHLALAQERRKFVSVKAFGAKGDGATDDTAAIQATINAARPGETIHFPPGTYDVSNFVIKNRSGLSFIGEGRNSVIRQKAGAARIATIEVSRDLVISNLTFDAYGIMAYGGLMFYSVSGIRIENNTFVDSAQKPWGKPDRNTFNFGRGGEPSRDIKILNNSIEDLQLDFVHSQRVIIDGNVIKRGGKTAGIGIYTTGHNAIAEDFQITNNTVIDPIGAGFNVGIDPPTDGKCIFRRITLADNQVIRTKTAGYGIRIGTPNNSAQTRGNVFENIVIKNNRFRLERGAPQPMQLIFANTSATAKIVFNGLTVSGNKVENDGPQGQDYAIDLRGLQKSLVADNTVRGVASGISLSGDLVSNEVRDNVVEASDVAYRIEGSEGSNRAANNRIIGKPRQGWAVSQLRETDSIER
jgi:polygalacturonase